MRAAILLAALAVLGGCATTPPMANSSFRAEFDRLETDCTTRGGMLTPTGANTGRVETDYACRIYAASRVKG